MQQSMSSPTCVPVWFGVCCSAFNSKGPLAPGGISSDDGMHLCWLGAKTARAGFFLALVTPCQRQAPSRFDGVLFVMRLSVCNLPLNFLAFDYLCLASMPSLYLPIVCVWTALVGSNSITELQLPQRAITLVGSKKC
ncbi:unnamed protein product [Ectocarpus sp. 12 AP-2014]